MGKRLLGIQAMLVYAFLYLPIIIDPEYHYETVNVEAQDRNPSSLLWWMRRIIALRQQHPVFGRGDIEFLYPENGKVLAFIRHFGDERVLVVANLAATVLRFLLLRHWVFRRRPASALVPLSATAAGSTS